MTAVAVGVLPHDSGRCLLTSRPAGNVYAGYWEFPGGKVEAGETIEEAQQMVWQRLPVQVVPVLPGTVAVPVLAWFA